MTAPAQPPSVPHARPRVAAVVLAALVLLGGASGTGGDEASAG